MPRLKFVATTINRASAGTPGFQSFTVGSTAMYLDSNAVEIAVDGTTTLIIDKVTKDQYHCSQTYTTTISRLDSASGSSVGYQIDLT